MASGANSFRSMVSWIQLGLLPAQGEHGELNNTTNSTLTMLSMCSSPTKRLPSLLASMGGSAGVPEAVFYGEGHTEEDLAVETPCSTHEPSSPLAPCADYLMRTPGPPPYIYPAKLFVLSPESDSLIVPTSCPHELEFPYHLASPNTFALDEFASGQPLTALEWVPSIEETMRLERASRV